MKNDIERITRREWYDLGGFATTGLFRKDRGRGWEYYIDHSIYRP